MLTYIDKTTGIIGDFDDLAVFSDADVPGDLVEQNDSTISEWVTDNANLGCVLYPMFPESYGE